VVENQDVSVEIRKGELISKITEDSHYLEIPTKVWRYPGNSGKTLSGLYVFNPTEEAKQDSLTLLFRSVQKGDYMTIVDSCYKSENNQIFSYSVTLYNSGCSRVRKGVRTVLKTYLDKFAEVTIRTDTNEVFTPYTDNSYSV